MIILEEWTLEQVLKNIIKLEEQCRKDACGIRTEKLQTFGTGTGQEN
jgi:hypothetical protein